MDRSAIMHQAWTIFRSTYHYPAVPFRSIGRPCFAWALREAWRQERAAARVAAIPLATRQARAVELRDELAFLTYRDDYRAAEFRRSEIKAEIVRLAI